MGAIVMSALGQKQTYAVQHGMSALPPIATSIAFFGLSALGQKRTSTLFDHLVDAGEKRRRHGKTKRLGGLEIDRQLVFGRRLYRRIRWLLPFEDAIDITGRPAALVEVIPPI